MEERNHRRRPKMNPTSMAHCLPMPEALSEEKAQANTKTQARCIVKICIGGPFAAGKTTLFKMLAGSGRFQTLIGDQPRWFQEHFPQVDWTILATRHFNFLNQCLKEAEAERTGSESILCDGGIFECIGHTEALTDYTHDPGLNYYHTKSYDLVLLSDHRDVPIEDDGLRHTSSELRENVASKILGALRSSGANFLLLNGSPSQRYATAMSAIEILKNRS